MSQSTPRIWLTLLGLLALSALACQTQDLVGQSVSSIGQGGGMHQINYGGDPTITPLPEGPLHAKTECSEFDHKCYVVVSVIAHAEVIQAILEIEVVDGIFFDWMDKRWIAMQSNQRRLRRVEYVEMMPGETRSFEIPYQIAMDANFPGEYAIAVRMLDSLEPDTAEPLATVYAKAFIGQSATGKIILLNSQAEFDALYSEGFVNGHINIAYRIDLENIVHPTRGTLYVKMINNELDLLQPRLTISIDGGIYFRTPMTAEQADKMTQTMTFSTESLGRMYKTGSRVVIATFDMDKDSENGLHAIQTIREGGTELQLERAPLGLELIQSIENRHDKWLVETQDDGMPITTPTPTPLPTPTFTPPAPIPTASLTPPAITPTPSFSAAVVHQATPQLERTVVATTTPIPPTRLTNVTATGDSAETIVWNRSVTGFYGNLWRAYHEFVRGQFELRFVQFKTEMRWHNPQLAVDSDVLQPGKTYLLPQLQPTSLIESD